MEVYSSVAAAVLVLGVFWWCTRRLALRRSGGAWKAVEVSGTQPARLTAQHTLHVVAFHGRELLIAAHPAGCSLLDAAPLAGTARDQGASA